MKQLFAFVADRGLVGKQLRFPERQKMLLRTMVMVPLILLILGCIAGYLAGLGSHLELGFLGFSIVWDR